MTWTMPTIHQMDDADAQGAQCYCHHAKGHAHPALYEARTTHVESGTVKRSHYCRNGALALADRLGLPSPLGQPRASNPAMQEKP